MKHMLVLVVSAAVAFGLPLYLGWLWRALPSVWRGERRRPPIDDFHIFVLSARSYLSGLLAITAWCGGFASAGAASLIYTLFDFDGAPDIPQAASALMAVFFVTAAVLLTAAVPLTVLQWVMNAFNRPRRLAPPRYRGKPGWVAERARHN